jgi:hypothetical protein
VRVKSINESSINADIITMHLLMHGTGIGDADTSGWYEKFNQSAVTRAKSDPLNVKRKNGSLELRKNFFSIRIVNEWNVVPADI